MVTIWVPHYSPTQEEFLFHCSTHKETEVMAVCSHDSETVVRDQVCFMDFVFVCGEAR